jgi:hypothetical protein
MKINKKECKYVYDVNEQQTHNVIQITGGLESAYYCDWYLRATKMTSFLIAFKNHNLDESKQNQFVVRVFNMTDKLSRTLYEESKFYKDVDVYPAEENNLGAQFRGSKGLIHAPVYEYLISKKTRHFQIDATYVKIQ